MTDSQAFSLLSGNSASRVKKPKHLNRCYAYKNAFLTIFKAFTAYFKSTFFGPLVFIIIGLLNRGFTAINSNTKIGHDELLGNMLIG